MKTKQHQSLDDILDLLREGKRGMAYYVCQDQNKFIFKLEYKDLQFIFREMQFGPEEYFSTLEDIYEHIVTKLNNFEKSEKYRSLYEGSKFAWFIREKSV